MVQRLGTDEASQRLRESLTHLGVRPPSMLWDLLRIPARGSTAAPKGHAAIGSEESASQLDGQTLVAGLTTLLDSTATTLCRGLSLTRNRTPLGPYRRPMPMVLGGP